MAYNVPLSSLRASDGNVTYSQNTVLKVGTGSNITVSSSLYESNGNVGIGTSTPTQKLHVVGNIQITNISSATSGIYFPNNSFQTTAGSIAGFIYGLEGSTAGASTTLTIASGQASDSTFNRIMVLASSMGKTTSAWVAGTGNGGLDTGTIANSTWYHWYLIGKTDGTTDVIFSLSASAPTLPSGYLFYRRILSMKTNGSGQWIIFVQRGDYFRVEQTDEVFYSSTTAWALTTLSTIPTGIVVMPLISGFSIAYDGQTEILMAPAADDGAFSILEDISISGTSGTYTSGPPVVGPPSNTSAQIYLQCTIYSVSAGSNAAGVLNAGWVDYRGRI